MEFKTKNKYLEDMVEKYADMVYRLALTRVKHIQNAEDVFQDVFYRLARKMPKFESEEHEKAWLIRVTINCSNTMLTSNSKKNETELKEEIKFESQEKSEIYFAVLKLSKKYRTLIHLFYYEGYKINEIAQMLNINENTIKSQLSRARETLKKYIEGGMEDA